MIFYPLNLDISDQLCLVIGGGTVASRKISGLLPCGARVRVISPEICPSIRGMVEEGVLEWKQRKFMTGDVTGAKLVFAATDNDTTQTKVVEEARAAGIPVNVVTHPENCTFHVPAISRQGELLISVTTGGGSPALAARIRKELQKHYGAEYGDFLLLLAKIRKQVIHSSDYSDEHKQVFQKLVNSDILVCIKEQRWEDLTQLLQQILPPEIDIVSCLAMLQNHGEKEMETLHVE